MNRGAFWTIVAVLTLLVFFDVLSAGALISRINTTRFPSDIFYIGQGLIWTSFLSSVVYNLYDKGQNFSNEDLLVPFMYFSIVYSVLACLLTMFIPKYRREPVKVYDGDTLLHTYDEMLGPYETHMGRDATRHVRLHQEMEDALARRGSVKSSKSPKRTA